MRDYMCMKIMTLRASTNLLLRGASRMSPHRGASVIVCRKLRWPLRSSATPEAHGVPKHVALAAGRPIMYGHHFMPHENNPMNPWKMRYVIRLNSHLS